MLPGCSVSRQRFSFERFLFSILVAIILTTTHTRGFFLLAHFVVMSLTNSTQHFNRMKNTTPYHEPVGARPESCVSACLE